MKKSNYLKGCLGVFILLVLGCGFLWWRWQTPPKVGEDFTKLTPAQQQERRDDANKLVDQVKELVHDYKDGSRKPFRLVANEQQLNTLLQDRIRTKKFVIHDLRVGLDNNQFSIQGVVPYKGIETTATLSGNVQVKDGKIDYNADKLLLGGLFEAPKDWKKKIEKQVTKQLNKLLENAKVDVTRAAVENKQLIIEGKPQ